MLNGIAMGEMWAAVCMCNRMAGVGNDVCGYLDMCFGGRAQEMWEGKEERGKRGCDA